jgi:hypothetical protein
MTDAMESTFIDAQSIVAIDLGSIHTRALLFDVVDGSYSFLGCGIAPTTINAPFRDVSECIHNALQQLEQIVGRKFLDNEGRLIFPSQTDGSGVDRLAVTFSAGPELRIATAGLLADVSLESAQHLAASVYGKVVESISLNDHRRPEMQIEAIVKAQPGLIILAGGTEQGATRSVAKMVDLINLVCQILPEGQRPQVLYAGNQALATRIKEILERTTQVSIAPNIRPGIDTEDLDPALEVLSQAVTKMRTRQIGGLQDFVQLASTPPLPTAQAFSRVIRYLNQIEPGKGVFGVDLGASSTSMVVADAGNLFLNVAPYGVGGGVSSLLPISKVDDFTQWMPIDIPANEVRDYLFQKSIAPASIPMTVETLAIEQALARRVIRASLRQMFTRWPQLVMNFEPILACGNVISQAPTPEESLLLLLDGLQPVGITTLFVDQFGLAASLGAASGITPYLPVQILESGVFLNLGTVISPLSRVRAGTPVMRVHLEDSNNQVTETEIKQGTIVTLPLQPGEEARVFLEAVNQTIIDPRKKLSRGGFKMIGGACGLVIDARGRPIVMPRDAAQRRDLVKQWYAAIGE